MTARCSVRMVRRRRSARAPVAVPRGARSVTVAVVRPSGRSRGRGRRTAKVLLRERHGHREDARALGAIRGAAGGLSRLADRARDLELEAALGAPVVVERHARALAVSGGRETTRESAPWWRSYHGARGAPGRAV